MDKELKAIEAAAIYDLLEFEKRSDFVMSQITVTFHMISGTCYTGTIDVSDCIPGDSKDIMRRLRYNLAGADFITLKNFHGEDYVINISHVESMMVEKNGELSDH